jgi:1,4-dihydroxy-2-naphthoate octaprenyltransferase
MTFISATIAGLLAARVGRFDAGLWAALTLGLVFAHATNNLVNDLTDSWKGVDKDNYFRTQYGPQPIEHGLMTRGQVILYAAVTGAVAIAAGVYLVAMRGQATLALFATGVGLVLFYTWPLKHIGLGEVAVLFVWGPLMVAGGYHVVTGASDWNVVWASLPFALGATAVIFGKHIDKLDADRQKGIRTMPVLLGDRASRAAVLGMLVLQYGLVIYLVAIRYFSPLLLIVLAALLPFRLAWRAYRHPRPAGPPKRFPKNVWPLWYVAFAFHHTRRFGMLYVVGLIADVVARRAGWLGLR